MVGRVLVRGSINIDEFFNVPQSVPPPILQLKQSKADLSSLRSIVNSGETISSTGYSRRAGGKGANQAVSASKAGGHVDLYGFLGNDGEWLLDELKGYGVGLAQTHIDLNLPTGRALIQLSTATLDNSIILLPGANHSTLPLPFPSSTPTLPYTHLLLQNEIPFQSTLDYLSAAKKAGITTIWNPSPMPSKEALNSFPFNDLDWLVVNEGESTELIRALYPGYDLDAKNDDETILRRLSLTRRVGAVDKADKSRDTGDG
ncbi:hypothetical protein P7C70_g7349, partial [Phenoliferia sp. Uapishka_3]